MAQLLFPEWKEKRAMLLDIGAMQLRFICVLDPLGLWTVWDEHSGQPAEADTLLVGLSEGAALRACHELNLRHGPQSAEARRPPGDDSETLRRLLKAV
jgi:hypothetical protein